MSKKHRKKTAPAKAVPVPPSPAEPAVSAAPEPSVPGPAPAPTVFVPVVPDPLPARTAALWAVCGVAFWLFAAYMFAGTELYGGIAAAALVLAGLLVKPFRRRLAAMVTPLTLAAAVFFLLISGLSSLHSDFGALSAKEFAKLLAAFAVFCLVLMLAERKRLRQLAWMLSGACAGFSLLSIDGSAAEVFLRPFRAVTGLLGCRFDLVDTGFESGTRITGIFGNANALAGMLAVGIFLALYLAHTSRTWKTQGAACLLLAVNAMGFFLAFSMGGMGFFAVSVLVFLAAAHRGERLTYFIRMVLAAALTILTSFAALQGLGQEGAVTALPYAALALDIALIWAAERFVVRPLSKALGERARLAGILVAVLVALVAAYAVLAFQITGAYDLPPGESLRRSAYPAAGDYTLSAAAEGQVNVTVTAQNEADTMMHTSSTLYRGDLSQAAFTVPEDAIVVYFTFSAPEGARLESVTYQGPETGQLKLGYKLLPEFVANRMQGLFANQNAIQRTVFFRDGMKLFAQSPVIGQGLAAYEGRIRSVQDFQYETRYVHNHYIQVLLESGAVGLLGFLAVLGCAVWSLRKLRRRDELALSGPLAASVMMLFGHAVTEATWSFGCFLVLALALLAMVDLAAGPELALPGRRTAKLALPTLWAVTALFTVAVSCHASASYTYSEIAAGRQSQNAYTMTSLARRDPYDWAQYKLDMAVNAATSEVPEFYDRAGEYAAQLRKLHIYSIDQMLVERHYFPRGEWETGFAVLMEGVLDGGSLPSVWQDAFAVAEAFFPSCPDSQWYARQVLALKEEMDQFNQGRMEQVSLNEQNLAFLEQMAALA